MNKVRQPKPEELAPEVAPRDRVVTKAGESVARKFIRALNLFGYFDKGSMMKVMPFVFFLTILAVVYIANSYIAERTIRDIDRTERELKELRSEFITGKSELMYRSKLSEVAVAIAPRGLKESTMAPKKIVVESSKP